MRECAKNRKELNHWTEEEQEIFREENKEKWEKEEKVKNKIYEYEMLEGGERNI